MKLRLRNLALRVFTAVLVTGMFFSLDVHRPAAAQTPTPPPRVEKQVVDQIQTSGSADFVIVMTEQADLSAAYGIENWYERGQYVYQTLRETAERSQKNVTEQLRRQGVRFESFFAGNEIYVFGGSQQTLNSVLDVSTVGSIRAPVRVKLDPAHGPELLPFKFTLPKSSLQAEIAWGIADAKAPAFWSTFNHLGEGIIVANIDSGVMYNHPALAAAYLCANGNVLDPRCWYDATGDPPQAGPQDDLGHGTHTMGTMVGSNSPALTNSVGMAPGARWIACRAFIGDTAADPDLLECADWILAPGGNPNNRPHIVNNSWGGSTTDQWIASRVNAWNAAGIFATFSAGNDGSPTTCSEMGSPADYQSAFTVAAHDQSRLLAPFSSKGPNALGDVPYTKPNLSAPGMSILSTYNNGSYTILEGTSMAAPHVSGAVALLWSCNPFLIGKVDQTFQLLQNSADASPAGTCGAPAAGGGNYSYGYGFLDVYQAGQSACTGILRTYLPLIQNTNQTPAWPDPTQNGGFESGQVSWTESSTHNYVLILSNSYPLPIQPYAGSWLAWLGGEDSEVSSIAQTIAIPAGRSVLHYWFASESDDSCGNDFFKVFAGTTELNFETLCTAYQTAGWVHRTLDLSPFAGTIQTLKFLAVTNSAGISSAMLDNISLEKTASLTGSIQSAPSSNLPR